MKKNEKAYIKLNYESAISVLPASVLGFVDRAKKFDIKVLLLLASSEANREEGGALRMAKALGCEQKDVEASVAFWNGTGLIDVCGSGDEKPAQSKPVEVTDEPKKEIPKRTKVSELPEYTTEELNGLLEKYQGVCTLIDECQQVLGKIFNTAEVKILMGLIDHLGLDDEYILVLMHYCNEIDRRSLRYLEKIAVSCLDEGITDAGVLETTLRAREEARQTEP